MRRSYIYSALITAASITIANAEGSAPESDREKCYGIAKPGENDCGGTNALGEAQTCQGWYEGDSKDQPYTWVYVKRGTCKSLGGQLVPPPLPPKNPQAD